MQSRQFPERPVGSPQRPELGPQAPQLAPQPDSGSVPMQILYIRTSPHPPKPEAGQPRSRFWRQKRGLWPAAAAKMAVESAVLDPAVEEWAVEELPQPGSMTVEAASRRSQAAEVPGAEAAAERAAVPDWEPQPAGRRVEEEEPPRVRQSAPTARPPSAHHPQSACRNSCRTSVRFALQHRSLGTGAHRFADLPLPGPPWCCRSRCRTSCRAHSLCRTLHKKPFLLHSSLAAELSCHLIAATIASSTITAPSTIH